jgi:H+/Cl- antiporter ClcA
MNQDAVNLIRIFAATVLLLGGIALGFLAVVTFTGPDGAQLPDGMEESPPPPWYSWAVLLVLASAMFAAGVRLLFPKQHRDN